MLLFASCRLLYFGTLTLGMDSAEARPSWCVHFICQWALTHPLLSSDCSCCVLTVLMTNILISALVVPLWVRIWSVSCWLVDIMESTSLFGLMDYDFLIHRIDLLSFEHDIFMTTDLTGPQHSLLASRFQKLVTVDYSPDLSFSSYR